MTTTTDRTAWLQVRTRVYLWWCGDHDCDCVQPTAERIEPNTKIGYPAVVVTKLWHGTFMSAFDQLSKEQHRQLLSELNSAAERFGVPVER